MPNPTDADAIDRRILENLQSSGRLTNLELAERAGLSPSPCLRRVRNLETGGVIEGYTAKLNREKIGLGLTAFVAINIERHSDAEGHALRTFVRDMPEIIACHITSGEYDFLLEVVTSDLKAFKQFTLEKLLRVPGVKDIRSSFAIDTLKENAPLPLSQLG